MTRQQKLILIIFNLSVNHWWMRWSFCVLLWGETITRFSFPDPDDPYKLTEDTRPLGLVVCRYIYLYNKIYIDIVCYIKIQGCKFSFEIIPRPPPPSPEIFFSPQYLFCMGGGEELWSGFSWCVSFYIFPSIYKKNYPTVVILQNIHPFQIV